MTKKLVLIVAAMFLTSCQFQNNSLAVGMNNKGKETPPDKELTEDRKTKKKPERQNIVLGQSKIGNWQVNAEKLEGNDLTSSYFTDVNNGWVIGRTGNSVMPGESVLHKTTDGGKSWQKIELNIPKNSSIMEIRFISDQKGWLTINTAGGGPIQTGLTIMLTEDGGINWKVLNQVNGIYGTKIAFLNDGEGWLAGFRKNKDSALRQGVILHTKDFGKNWDDVSPTSANVLIADQQNKLGIVSSWNDVRTEQDSTAIILSDRGEILKTTDGGAAWIYINKIPSDQAGNVRGLTDDFQLLKPITDLRFLTVGGLNSQEGTFASFAVMDENEIYHLSKLNDVYVSDVAYLGNGEFIFCGSRVESNVQERVERRGIVFYTKDMKNWEVIHETDFECKNGCLYNKISIVGEKLLLVGNNGDLTWISKSISE